MKFLIKKSPDGFIKSVNDEISSILKRNGQNCTDGRRNR